MDFIEENYLFVVYLHVDYSFSGVLGLFLFEKEGLVNKDPGVTKLLLSKSRTLKFLIKVFLINLPVHRNHKCKYRTVTGALAI